MSKIFLKGKAIIAMLLVIAVLAFAGCSGSSTKNSSTNGNKKQVVLTLWYPWAGPDGDAVVSLAKEYSKTHPNVQIKAQMVSGAGIAATQGGGQGKFLSAVAAGNPPDLVLYWGQDALPGLADQGAIIPLDDYLKDVDTSKFFEAAYNAMKYNGKIYGLPEMVNVRVLFWNKDLFKQAGLDPNTPPKTIAELDQMAAKLTKTKNGAIEQMGFIPWIGQGVPHVMAGVFGTSLVDSNGNPILSPDKNPQLLNLLKWEVSYSDKYGAMNINKFIAGMSQNSSQANDPFILGKVAMMISGEWQINANKQYNPKLNFGVGPIPQAPGGKPMPSLMDGNTWMIPKGSKHPQEAMDFIKWTMDPQRIANTADKVYNIAPIVEAAKMQKLNNDPYFKEVLNVAQKGSIYYTPAAKGMLSTETAANNAFQAAQYKKSTPEQALKNAQAEAEKSLSQ
ncbi:ABC transporter substrate-binding protein [Caldanaerobius polysaccharolyticus]|uniref:ABC transporter substrate-binding protein n=1 Tax=Caldanaerobius polysaccharolyticus TaxID=44256 RepID=UPI000479EE93|nr:ABC transporter substrate-binding protein [Caldanaerobius polysaccharolyticus]